MRICLITLDFLPFRSSGLAVYAEHLAIGLHERGHQVIVVAAQRRADEHVRETGVPLGGIHVERLDVGKGDWLALGIQARRWLSRNRRFEVVHFLDAHFAFASPRPFLVSAFQSFRQRLTSNRGLPYHTTLTNLAWRLVYYSAARHTLEPLALNRAVHVIASSYATQREFHEHYKLPLQRMSMVYPGIDLQPFRSLPSRERARSMLGLPSEAFVLLFVGFGGPRKGLEHLAAALSALPPSVILVLVGRWNLAYRDKFLSLLRDQRPRALLRDYVPESEKPLYYAAADVLVHPSLLEGFGLSLAEAMAAGLPVVTTTGGASPEVVAEAGIAVAPGDARALADAILELMESPTQRARLAEAARQRAALFDRRRMSEQIESVYLNHRARR